MEFEWDPRKDAANRRKHKLEFREAATVFGDPLAIPDVEHSALEQRFLTIGTSVSDRLLVVAHTERGEAIRIIRARPVAPREKRFQEDEY
ncbi:MAG: BrnT family toxin [Candidatus Sulfotelmatobacter sp.]|jgi:uncharacterized DUF497 family protein